MQHCIPLRENREGVCEVGKVKENRSFFKGRSHWSPGISHNREQEGIADGNSLWAPSWCPSFWPLASHLSHPVSLGRDQHRLWASLSGFEFWFYLWLDLRKTWLLICKITVIRPSLHRVLSTQFPDFISGIYHYSFLVLTLSSLLSPSFPVLFSPCKTQTFWIITLLPWAAEWAGKKFTTTQTASDTRQSVCALKPAQLPVVFPYLLILPPARNKFHNFPSPPSAVAHTFS